MRFIASMIDFSFQGCSGIFVPFLATFPPISLAYWFQDDGSKCKHRGLLLHTDCFSLDETELICEWMKKTYNIICKPQKNGKKWRTFFSNKTSRDFAELISPNVCPSMRYKIEGTFLKNPQRPHAVQLDLFDRVEDMV